MAAATAAQEHAAAGLQGEAASAVGIRGTGTDCATIQSGPVTADVEQVEMEKGNSGQGRRTVVKRLQEPIKQGVHPPVRVMLPGKAENQFIGQHCRAISLPVGPQGEKGIFQVRLAEKVEAVLSGRSVADIKQRKLFQFIDKPLLRAFGPLGDSGESASVRAVQGDNPVRFTVIDIFKDNTFGTAGSVRQAGYSEAISCCTVWPVSAALFSCVGAATDSVAEGADGLASSVPRRRVSASAGSVGPG